MKPKKDGRYLNCYIDRPLLENFEALCEKLGKTKTQVLEEAMRDKLRLYSNENADGSFVFDPKPAIYIDRKGAENSCMILNDNVTMFGESYCSIYIHSHTVIVPIGTVREV